MANDPGVETVTVIRVPKTDPLRPKPTTPPPTHEIEGCAIVPRSSNEEGRGWVTIDGHMVAAPYDADVLATDHVRTPDGVEWQVEGTPARSKNKRGKEKACIFYLERVGTA